MRVKIVYNQPFLFISNTFESFRLRMNAHYISTDTINSDTVGMDRFGMLINVLLLLIVCDSILVQNCSSVVKMIDKKILFSYLISGPRQIQQAGVPATSFTFLNWSLLLSEIC